MYLLLFAFQASSLNIEGLVWSLHSRVTFLLLLGCCVLVTCLDWVGNGNIINCILKGFDPDLWSIPKKMLNTYCYAMNTFTLPSQLAGSIGVNMAAPGVRSYQTKSEDILLTAYYRWVPFVLFGQACCFYAPHVLFKVWEGGKVVTLLI